MTISPYRLLARRQVETMAAVDTMPHTTVADLLNQTRSTNPYTPGRDPYTYACDFIRTNPHTIPAAVRDQVTIDNPSMMSRADASRIRQAWASFEGRDDEDLARTLADAYMRTQGIRKP